VWFAVALGACTADTPAPQNADSTQINLPARPALSDSNWQFVLDDSLGLFIQAPPSLASSLELRIACDSLPRVLDAQQIYRYEGGDYHVRGGPPGGKLALIRGDRWLVLHGRRSANQPLLAGFVRRQDNCWLTVGVDELNQDATPEVLSRMLQSVRFRQEDAK
jgi:hypothetical protein